MSDYRLNTYFDKIYCINLKNRTDKWAECLREFRKHGLEVERFCAVDGRKNYQSCGLSPGEAGCSLSHAKILEEFYNSNLERILILEDDIEFIADLTTEFSKRIIEVPDWELLYLGGTHMEQPSKVNNYFSRARKTYTTSHYGIRRSVVPLVIEEIRRLDRQVDVVLADKQPTTNAYVFTPAIAWQRPSFSDIHHTRVDYTRWMKPPTE